MSILPPNSSSLENAIDDTCAVRIEGIDVPLKHLLNPDKCPEHLLPWLAWAVSVDEWDSSWSEKQKRATIAASPVVHRHKGTRYAVNTALEALEYDVTAAEWWEVSPKGRPGTYWLKLKMPPDQGCTEKQINQVVRVVDAAKNKRSHLNSVIVERVKMGSVSRGGAVRQHKRLLLGTISKYSTGRAHRPVGGVVRIRTTKQIRPQVFVLRAGGSSAFAGAAVRTVNKIRIGAKYV